MATVDGLRVAQVLANLLDNALKYGPMNRPIEVSLERSERGISVSVRDQGRGIPAEDREHVFGRFQQVHEQDHLKGFGLGLYVCQQIVDRHGGSIRVEAPGDGGTRVVVELPE